MNLSWQQKAAALNSLAPINILMRGPSDWYVSQGVEVKQKSVLRSVCGNGDTPESAIQDHWEQACEDLCHGEYLVVNAGNAKRRAVEWNGFMWTDRDEDKQ